MRVGRFVTAYSYDQIGRIVNGPAGLGYAYNAAQPHAVTGVNTAGGVDSYSYDPAGNRQSWNNADGADYSYSWDTQGRLTAATATPGGATSYLYDSDRQQVMRKDPNGTVTVFLGGLHEITRTTAGVRQTSRFYTLESTAIAVRGPSGLEFTLGDQHGSIHTTIGPSTGVRRTHYTPYGDIRSETNPGPSTNHRYLNQIDEPNSGLNYQNNRYHDPALGTFISVDPLIATTGEPYLYGSGNPTTLSDASGLCAVVHGEFYCGDTNYGEVTGSHPEKPEPYDQNLQPYSEFMKEESLKFDGEPWRPFAWITDPIRDIADAFDDQLIDPLTCGVRGVNPVARNAGSCSGDEEERRDQLVELGQATCEASRTPVVGSMIPEFSTEGFGILVVETWADATLGLFEAGLRSPSGAATTASRAIGSVGAAVSIVNGAATTVDVACRLSTGSAGNA